MAATIDELNAMDAEGLREALGTSPERTAAIVRSAAEGGSAEAQVVYGQLLLDGRGVTADPAAALRWFGEAAHNGHVMAMNMVGRCCEKGWGTVSDPAQAAAWYRAAADRGLDWGMYNLATLLTLGEGIAEDRTAALVLFRRAADLGHAKSINMVGSFYEDGWVVERNLAAAADLYARAAQGGDFRGMFNYARFLVAAGEIQQAVNWLRRLPAAANGPFLAKVRAWLADQPLADLRDMARQI